MQAERYSQEIRNLGQCTCFDLKYSNEINFGVFFVAEALRLKMALLSILITSTLLLKVGKQRLKSYNVFVQSAT